MSIYQNGKIYAIKSPHTEEVYIGSTCDPLKNRLIKHKSAYKCLEEKGIGGFCTSYIIIKAGEAFIELVEEYPCESRKELEKREGKVQQATENSVNKMIAGRTWREWRKDNPGRAEAITKAWRERNKEHIKEYNKQYSSGKDKCLICDKEYAKGTLLRHYRTEYHLIRVNGDTRTTEQRKKDYDKVWKAKKVKCECGDIVSRSALRRHQRRKVHKDKMEQVEKVKLDIQVLKA